MVNDGSKHGYQYEMCYKWIEPRAQNMKCSLGSIINISEGDLYDYLINKRNVNFSNEEEIRIIS